MKQASRFAALGEDDFFWVIPGCAPQETAKLDLLVRMGRCASPLHSISRRGNRQAPLAGRKPKDQRGPVRVAISK